MDHLDEKELYRNGINAFYTVEASFVVPMALLVVVFILQISFYMYGRCIAVQDSYLIAFKGSIMADAGDAGQNDYMYAYSEAILNGKYFGNDVPVLSITHEGKSIITKLETDTYHNAVDMLAPWLNGSWHIKASGKAESIDRSAGIRKMSRLQDIAEMALK